MSKEQTTPSSHSGAIVHDSLPIILNPDGSITRAVNFPVTPAASPPSCSSSPVHSKDLPLNPQNRTWLRLFLPCQPLPCRSSAVGNKLPLIIYFHGGGFILGSAATSFFHSFCSEMAAQVSTVVVSVEYRLAPEHRLPAAYDDAMEALHWIKSSSEDWLCSFADFSNCFIAGTSAGGNIAYHAGIRAVDSADDLEPLKIRGLILHEPCFCGARRTPSLLRSINNPVLPLFLLDLMWELVLPIGADRDHRYCNATAGNEGAWERMRVQGWRVMLTGCDGDPTVDRQVELSKRMEEKGVTVAARFEQGGYHGVAIREPAKAKALFAEIRNFVHLSLSVKT